MKTKLLIALAGLVAFVGCNKKVETSEPSAENTGKVAFTVSFEAASDVKAPLSKAIPTTSWDNVKTLQFLLYNNLGLVKYAYQTTALPATNGGKKTFTYTDVPVGTYTIVAVANANPAQKVTTFVGGSEMIWNGFNVREKNVNTLQIQHKSGTFPNFASSLAPTNAPFDVPGEVFMASQENVVINNGATTAVNNLQLKREVSMLRALVNVDDTDAGVNNTTTGNDGVDWATNVSIMVYRLPDYMLPMHGNNGGVAATSTATKILISEGNFKTENPTDGYGDDKTIISGNFKMWKDIVVFPNYDGRQDTQLAQNARTERQYYIVVSAQGKKDHVLADGTKLDAPTTIYWKGLAKGKFTPNTIREVRLTLKSGGQKEVPTEPGQEGGLTVEMGDLIPWNSVITEESLVL